MDFRRNVVILFLVVFVSQLHKFCSAQYPVQTFDGQHEIFIQPSSALPQGATFVRGVILPNATVMIILDYRNVVNASFVIFQAHSYIEPLVLSSTVPLKDGNYSNGTDIGLYSKLPPLIHTISYFVSNPNNVTVDMMLVPIFYSKEDPVPGGCNLNFPVDIAPFMTLSFDPVNFIVQVDAQAASAQEQTNCDPIGLSYNVYEYYPSNNSADAYFDAILSVITAEKAADHGVPSLKPIRQPELRRRFAAYPGFGSIYVVTVRNVKTGRSSAYVPISNFNCADVNDVGCSYNEDTVWVLCIATFVFICVDIGYIFRRNMEVSMRSVFILASLIILLPTLPLYIGEMLISLFAMTAVVTWGLPEPAPGQGKLIRGFWIVVDQAFAVVPAHIFLGLLAYGLIWLPFFQNWLGLVSSFFAVFLLCYICHQFGRDNFFDVFCGTFFLLSLVSFVSHGVMYYVFKDPSRFLRHEFSDVMFSPPLFSSDYIILIFWPFIATSHFYMRKVLRLRTKFTSGEYRVIVNEPPLLSSRPDTYNTM